MRSWSPPSLEINSTRYPWAFLHNDSQCAVTYAGRSWPTVTHAVYASILPIPFFNEVSKLSDPAIAKKAVQRLYQTHLNNIRKHALELGYQAVFEQHLEFRNALKQYQYQIEYENTDVDPIIQTVSPDGVVDDTEGNSAITYILRSLHRKVATTRIHRVKVARVNRDSPISPYQSYSFVINELRFSTIMEYVYYTYLMYFVPTYAYDIVSQYSADIKQLEKEAYNAIQTFCTVKVTHCLNKVLAQKFGNVHFAKLLNALPVPFMMSDATGHYFFLTRHVYIQTENAMLRAKRQGIGLRYLQVLDYTYWSKYEARQMHEWITGRLFNLFTLTKTVLIYSRKESEPITNDMMKATLTQLFICDLNHKNVLVYHYPLSWESDMVKAAKHAKLDISQLDSFTKYLLWRYSCVLMYRAREPKNIPYYIQSVPVTFTKQQIYEAIRTILRKLYLLQLHQLRDFVINARTIDTIQSMVRIAQRMKLDSPTSSFNTEMVLYQYPPKRNLALAGKPIQVKVGKTQVHVDSSFLKYIAGNLLEYVPIEVGQTEAKLVYQLVEFIYLNQYAYSSTVRSMLFYFS